MAKYWLKIALGAAAIFVVGMLIIRVVRSSARRVRSVVSSTEPITLPLVMVPFRVDSVQLGTIRRVRLARSSPRRISAVRMSVRLADSVDSGRFADCLLVARDVQRLDANTSLECLAPADTAGLGLVGFGTVDFDDGELQRPLLLPATQVDEIGRAFEHDLNPPAPPPVPNADSLDSAITERVNQRLRRADSLAAAAERRADSATRSLPR